MLTRRYVEPSVCHTLVLAAHDDVTKGITDSRSVSDRDGVPHSPNTRPVLVESLNRDYGGAKVKDKQKA